MNFKCNKNDENKNDEINKLFFGRKERIFEKQFINVVIFVNSSKEKTSVDSILKELNLSFKFFNDLTDKYPDCFSISFNGDDNNKKENYFVSISEKGIDFFFLLLPKYLIK